jgi:hypothetical protein
MPTIRIALPFVLVAVLAACSSAAPPAGTPGGLSTSRPTQPTSQSTPAQQTEAPAAEADATPGTTLTACELVAPADIETALGLDAGTVAEGEYEANPSVLDPAGNDCTYNDDWGGVIVAVTPTDGVNVYDALVHAFGEDAEALDIGDGALWFENNDRGYFLKGPVMVRLQFTHVTEGGLDSFRDPTVALGEAALAKI